MIVVGFLGTAAVAAAWWFMDRRAGLVTLAALVTLWVGARLVFEQVTGSVGLGVIAGLPVLLGVAHARRHVGRQRT